MATRLTADGSSPADAPATVAIDTDDRAAAWRYTCPAGHRTWQPTNGGVWCQSCANSTDIEDPHYHEIYDTHTKRTIPWSAVRLK